MKVLTMYNYLKYRLYMLKHYDQHKEENGEECEVVSDIKKHFNFFDYILMDPEQKLINFITPTELFVHRKFTKKIYDKSHKTIFIGRDCIAINQYKIYLEKSGITCLKENI